MKRMRYVDRPHLYLSCFPCGCKIWSVRRPTRLNHFGFLNAVRTRDTAKRWNVERFCGAGPCKTHTLKNYQLEQQP